MQSWRNGLSGVSVIVGMAAICMTLAGCRRAPDGSAQPVAANAWVRLAAIPGRPAAAYLTLTGGDRALRLAGVASPSVGHVELHEGGMHDGMMTMRPLNGLDLPAHATHAFAPGGDHLMLFGVDPALKPGGTLPLTLSFVGGPAVPVRAKLVGAGDPAPEEGR